MKKPIHNTIFTALLATAATLTLTLTARAANQELLTRAQQTKANFLAADPGLQTFFNNSAGYAVFSDVGKGGFIVGGARGRGLVFNAQGQVLGEAKMTQASIGAQAGGQSFDEIIFFDSPASLQNFTNGNFELSADISAVAVTAGASQAARFNRGVAVFTMPLKGLMVQATVGGQKFSFEPYTTNTR